MFMKEYNEEGGEQVDISKLRVPKMPFEHYMAANAGLVIVCHDVIVDYNDAALLVQRKIFPAKDIYWPIGGRVQKGMPIEESLKAKVKEECKLDLSDIVELGIARTFWKTDPFGHGRGVDTINFMFYGKGSGTLELNDDHYNAVLVEPEDYTPSVFQQTLHPYVQEIMDKAIPLIKRRVDEDVEKPAPKPI